MRLSTKTQADSRTATSAQVAIEKRQERPLGSTVEDSMTKAKAGPPLLIDCLGVLVGEQRGALRSITGLIKEIVRAAPDRCIIWVNRTSRRHFEMIVGRENCLVAPISGRNRTLRLLWQMVAGPIVAAWVRPRVYVSSSVFPMLGFSCPTAAFLRDLIPFHFPEVHGKVGLLLRGTLIRWGVSTAKAVLTVSQASASDIGSRFNKHVGRIFVVPNGADTCWAARESECNDQALLDQHGVSDRPFVLSILGGHLYKNPLGLAQAADLLCRQHRSEVQVVVVGDAVQQYANIPQPPNLRVLGVVNDRLLGALYRKARAMVYPTFLEGFGRPVIDAQALGLLVVCSDIPVLREISGGAAIFVDPSRPTSIAAAILTAVDEPDRWAGLVSLGYDNASLYTWGRSLEAFLSACDQLSPGRSVHAEHAEERQLGEGTEQPANTGHGINSVHGRPHAE